MSDYEQQKLAEILEQDLTYTAESKPEGKK